MTVQLMRPFDIGDSFTSSIAEPDLTVGEEEWKLSKNISSLAGLEVVDIINDGLISIVIVNNSDLVYRSEDGGETWSTVALGWLGDFPRCIGKYGGVMLIFGGSGRVSKSINSGVTWSNFKTAGSAQLLLCSASYDLTVTASAFVVYKSIREGDYSPVAINGTVSSIAVSGKICMIAANDSNGYKILRSSDGQAASFSILDIPINQPRYVDIAGSLAVATGNDGSVAVSNDSGETWVQVQASEISSTQIGRPYIVNNQIVISAFDGLRINGSIYQAAISNVAATEFHGFNVTPDNSYSGLCLFGISSNYMTASRFQSGNHKTTKIDNITPESEVIKASNHKKYRSTTSYNFDDPTIGVKKAPPTWVEIGATNKYAMFSSGVSQKSAFGNGGTVTLNDIAITNSTGIFGIAGVVTASIEVRSQGGALLYSESKSGLDQSGAFDNLQLNDIIFEYPPFQNVDVTVNLTGTDIKIGVISTGLAEEIGVAVAGTQLGDVDYSTLEYDEFGNVKYIERPIVPYHTFQTDVEKRFSLAVARKIQSVRGVNAVWIADIGEQEKLVAYGRCERSPITYDNPSLVSYSIKVKGSV